MPNDKPTITTNLEKRIAALEHALGTALSWIAQSANSPLRADEVEEILVKMAKDGQ
jgi:hypothetical protein